MPLIILDYTASQKYMTKSWGSGSAQTGDKQHAIIRAKHGELPKLIYPGDANPSNLDAYPNEIFDYLRLGTQLVPVMFEELLDAGGGLILGFAFRHGLMDGTTTTEFLDYVTGDMFAVSSPLNVFSSLHLRKENSTLCCQYSHNQPYRPSHHRWLRFNSPAVPPLLPTAIAKIFTISADSVRVLHTATLSHLRQTYDPSASVTIRDALCALIWVQITRVRLRARGGDGQDDNGDATATTLAAPNEAGGDNG
ncbi:hypothetical protein N657DRAFT_675725 [Parathielavia appendiculata]|uniref:Uncharacterized protein n=1 Tax=Parathielavia appendiculata TaxID=2587402 RepID=A0AAN6TPA3_9PEZI|nr:hypothetical protein N657DRAFT_675725 [Parathielavia appendiculata]